MQRLRAPAPAAPARPAAQRDSSANRQSHCHGKDQALPTPNYTSKQPSDPVVPKVPCTGIFLGPSKSGKTVALISLILEQYRGVFKRVYIFSPSININDGWMPVKRYISLRCLSACACRG